jgi:E3 ubiquitin-protein ligase HUWE1
MIAFEGNVEETFELNFQIQYDNFGVLETYDLVPDGANVPVTNANRQGALS